jgi:hypothetical protein
MKSSLPTFGEHYIGSSGQLVTQGNKINAYKSVGMVGSLLATSPAVTSDLWFSFQHLIPSP